MIDVGTWSAWASPLAWTVRTLTDSLVGPRSRSDVIVMLPRSLVLFHPLSTHSCLRHADL